jgi:hypothetical protein
MTAITYSYIPMDSRCGCFSSSFRQAQSFVQKHLVVALMRYYFSPVDGTSDSFLHSCMIFWFILLFNFARKLIGAIVRQINRWIDVKVGFERVLSVTDDMISK